MKILVVKEDNPNNYHRIQLPCEYLLKSSPDIEITGVSGEITEMIIADKDIIWIHHSSPTTLIWLSIWREKYGFKIIADFDDVWTGHNEEMDFLSQHLAILADHCICSTEYIRKFVNNFNPSNSVIHNGIPYGDGQFQLKKKRLSGKLRVGIAGSLSHFDDWMSMRNVLQKICSDKDLISNIEFVVIGYSQDDAKTKEKWDKIVNLFPNPTVIERLPYTKYMDAIDLLDIMLHPMLDTPLNRGRSNLRVQECACKDIVLLTSDIMSSKDGYNFTVCWESNWYNLLKDFARNPTPIFRQIKESAADFRNRKRQDYQLECVNPRLELFEEVINRGKTFSNNKIFSICYDLDQQVEYERIFNYVPNVEKQSYLFEYNPMRDIIPEVSDTYRYIAMFSHKFPFKTGFYRKYVERILNGENADVVVFGEPIPHYITMTETHHPGFMELFKELCERLDLTIPGKGTRGHCVYSNFFAAKPNIYRMYIESAIKPAIAILEGEMAAKVWKNAQYKNGLSADDLKRYTGLEYYPFHTFLLERLMTVWLYNNPKLKVSRHS